MAVSSFQSGAAKAFEIVFAIGVMLPGQLRRDPGERNIGLGPAQLRKRAPGEFDLAGHAGGDRQHPIGAGEVAALPGRLARQCNRFLIVPSDELGVGRNAVIDRGRGVARALADGALRRRIGVRPPTAIAQRQGVVPLRQREVRVELERQLELGQRMIEPARGEVDAGERGMRPGILAVGGNRRQCRSFG